MAALPEEDHPAVADRPAASPTSEAGDTEAEVRRLYAIPQVEVAPAEPGRLQQAMSDLQPPQFWTEPTPSPAEELNRAKHGRHLQSAGVMRKAAITYSVVAGAINVRDKFWIWARSHPMRMLTVLGVLGVLVLTPARPVVAYVLFGFGHWMFTLLVD